MSTDQASYRFGDLLALARRSWVLAMTRELAVRGFPDYRLTDAASIRLLRAGPLSLGELAGVLGVTRQAARKVADGLQDRGLAATRAEPADARKVLVVLTEAGAAYERAVSEAIELLNSRIASQVGLAELRAADAVLRAAVTDSGLRRVAARIPPPGPPGGQL